MCRVVDKIIQEQEEFDKDRDERLLQHVSILTSSHLYARAHARTRTHTHKEGEFVCIFPFLSLTYNLHSCYFSGFDHILLRACVTYTFVVEF